MEIYLGKRKITVKAAQSIGKGGEADVFDIGNGRALKIFKPPTHPDFAGQSQEQQAARMRIEEHQRKLPAFPKLLSERVVVPEELAMDKSGKILGYSMRLISGAEVLLRYGERAFREGKIPADEIVKIFQDLCQTVSETHKTEVVIGDFNDLNVLVRGRECYLIDTDSFQLKGFPCRLYTVKFVDPKLCEPNAQELLLVKPHTRDSDWYAYAVMLMQCLLFVGPYGGVYKPKNLQKRVTQNVRPLKRITVFNPEVVYPKPALHYKVLPDDLLQYLYNVFVKDHRGTFPRNLLDDLRWTTCLGCGMEHARTLCPYCKEAAPAAIKEIIAVRGKVTSKRKFATKGLILFATYQDGELKWLYHESGKFKREDGLIVAEGSADPFMRFRIQDKRTIIGTNSQISIFSPNEAKSKIPIDVYQTLPMFGANSKNIYWMQGGQLIRDDDFGTKYIGDALQNQTLFWIGPNFGFGFYRAGEINVAFVFDAEARGINDRVKIPQIKGQLIDSTCFFSEQYCWFFTAIQERGKIINWGALINSSGSVEAMAEAEKGDGSWLSGIRGKCAASNFLLCVTDEGIVRVEAQNGRIVKTKEFPDTEPFVDSGNHIFPGHQGLYVVDSREIRLLTISK